MSLPFYLEDWDGANHQIFTPLRNICTPLINMEFGGYKMARKFGMCLTLYWISHSYIIQVWLDIFLGSFFTLFYKNQIYLWNNRLLFNSLLKNQKKLNINCVIIYKAWVRFETWVRVRRDSVIKKLLKIFVFTFFYIF